MENDKDRFGEKTTFVERANEDIYSKCPGRLEKYTFMGFVLDRCESCEGIWLDKGELKGILRKAARGPLGAFLDRCFAKDETEKKS